MKPHQHSYAHAAVVIYGCCIVGLALRFLAFDFVTRDYRTCLEPWYDFLVKHGRFAAFRYDFSDYTPFYLYLVSFATFLDVKPVYAIKLLNLPFEAVLIWLFTRFPWSGADRGKTYDVMFLSFILSPILIMNGALWGQCDVIYGTFAIGFLLCAAKNQPALACLMFGFAISIKLQAIFLAPLLPLLLWTRQIRIRHLLLIPLVYILLAIPCFFAGRSATSLALIYLLQSGRYEQLTLNAPNIYQWISPEFWDKNLARLGIGVAGTFCLGIVAGFLKTNTRRARMSYSSLVTYALLFAVAVPFFLPHMHERYFFLADMIVLLYVVCNPRRWYLALCISGASLISYLPFLFGIEPIPLSLAAMLNATALLILFRDVMQLSEPWRGTHGKTATQHELDEAHRPP